MATPTLREELLHLLQAGSQPREPHCMRYHNGCVCPTCQKRSARVARARVRSDETHIMVQAFALGVPVDRPAARAVLARYGSVGDAVKILSGMKQAQLRKAT